MMLHVKARQVSFDIRMKLTTLSYISFEIELSITKINEVMLRNKWLIALGGKICVSIVTF